MKVPLNFKYWPIPYIDPSHSAENIPNPSQNVQVKECIFITPTHGKYTTRNKGRGEGAVGYCRGGSPSLLSVVVAGRDGLYTQSSGKDYVPDQTLLMCYCISFGNLFVVGLVDSVVGHSRPWKAPPSARCIAPSGGESNPTPVSRTAAMVLDMPALCRMGLRNVGYGLELPPAIPSHSTRQM